ncbi:unnamed protein product [Amoebophrya sp. A120]|nr:unnamed protein product [Amoebophrya sp. A120]|eukprot:GSA120T00015952001.1
MSKPTTTHGTNSRTSAGALTAPGTTSTPEEVGEDHSNENRPSTPLRKSLLKTTSQRSSRPPPENAWIRVTRDIMDDSDDSKTERVQLPKLLPPDEEEDFNRAPEISDGVDEKINQEDVLFLRTGEGENTGVEVQRGEDQEPPGGVFSQENLPELHERPSASIADHANRANATSGREKLAVELPEAQTLVSVTRITTERDLLQYNAEEKVSRINASAAAAEPPTTSTTGATTTARTEVDYRLERAHRYAEQKLDAFLEHLEFHNHNFIRDIVVFSEKRAHRSPERIADWVLTHLDFFPSGSSNGGGNYVDSGERMKRQGLDQEINPAQHHLPHRPQIQRNFLARFLAALIRVWDLDIPFLLLFSLLCLLVHYYANDDQKMDYFTFYPWELTNVKDYKTYLRIFTQSFAHGNAEHMRQNLTHLMLVGPTAEHQFGAYGLLKLFFWISVSCSVYHLTNGHPDAGQLGCSGFVFALIILHSLIYLKAGRIPLTFVIQFIVWCPRPAESGLYTGFYMKYVNSWFSASSGNGNSSADNIPWSNAEVQTAHGAHFIGCVVGALLGYHFHHEKLHHTVKHIALTWQLRVKEKHLGDRSGARGASGGNRKDEKDDGGHQRGNSNQNQGQQESLPRGGPSQASRVHLGKTTSSEVHGFTLLKKNR